MKASRNRWIGFVALLLLLLAGSSPLFAQGLTAALTGIVADQSKAVVPGANVILKQESTGAVRRTVTNENGYFSIVGIPPTGYALTVAAPGFQTWQRTGLTINAGDRISLPDIELALATSTEKVEVVAQGAEVIPVDTGEKAHLISAKHIQNLAVLGRSADELLKVLPGVVYANAGEDPPGTYIRYDAGVAQFNVNGMRNTAMANLSDGANVWDPACNCGAAVTPNVDMVQEVKIQTSNFSAENPLGPMAFNAVSKSGTAQFHGTGYLYAARDRGRATLATFASARV